MKNTNKSTSIAQLLWCNILEYIPHKIALGILLGVFLSIDDFVNGCEFNYLVYNFLACTAGAFIIWSGSATIAKYIDQKYDWEKYAAKKGILLVLINIIYIGICIFVIIWVMSAVLHKEIPLRYYINSYVYSIFCTTIINLIFISMSIFHFWKNTKLENEVLKQENLRSQLETLKNQVNPHFLFNSLNTLISIIDEEPEIAKNFTQKLSQVYRYILQAKEKDVVSLSEELQFSEAYEYMLTIRYGENLKFIKSIPKKYLDKGVPPLVLQMLVENAIKHNVISADKPLKVLIFIDETEHLVVQNNFQPKIINVESSKVGLKNIADRYKLLFHNEIIVENTKTYFSVKLPLSVIN